VTGAGVCQLLSAVKTISASPEKLTDWLKGIKTIIPVIITKDDVGSSWAVNAYLNRRFKDQRSKVEAPNSEAQTSPKVRTVKLRTLRPLLRWLVACGRLVQLLLQLQ